MLCKIDLCCTNHYAKGYCEKHYARVRRNGHADQTKPAIIIWSASDIAILTDCYINLDQDLFSVKTISSLLGRSEDAITLKAGKLGLTNPNRRPSVAARNNMSAAQVKHFSDPANRERLSKQAKSYIKKNGHPKGMRGKHHTENTKAIISAKSLEAAKCRSVEDKNKMIMKGLKTRAKNGTLAPPRNNTTWKAGWREIGGYQKYYRSRWEANYARYLEYLKCSGLIIDWLHEPDTFWFECIKRGVRSYLPDFKVTENDGSIIYHEVKGWMDAKSATKLKRMKKYHNKIKIILIQEKEYREIAVKLGATIQGWEGV